MSFAPRVGIDLLEIERLERALERRPRLAERLFTADERAYSERLARPGQHLAARFCAKEAATKALGLSVLRPLDVEVGTGSSDEPTLVLRGVAAERAGQLGVVLGVSLTHSRFTAGAVVVAGAS
ncbi:MAG: holo-ACP synthase [Actinomycetes bacterium]